MYESSPAALDRQQRREALKAVYEEARVCIRCAGLAESRQNVVFGAGNADAELMFVGEAPGANEDRMGLPFVGQAGKLLDRLLSDIGLQRADVWIGNVLKCRPPGNRDPHPVEIENCRGYLVRQVELIQPRLVCTLGNFATKLLRDDPAGITRVHGRAEVRIIGRRAVHLYPLYHPAAALYTPRMLQILEEDFSRIPGLLSLQPPTQPGPLETPDLEVPDLETGGDADAGDSPSPKDAGEDRMAEASVGAQPSTAQLGLF